MSASNYTIPTTAIVTSPPKDGLPQWAKAPVKARSPSDDEVLVRVLATGICHTDLALSMWPPEMSPIPYPKVLGHEGAGIVEQVGSKISHVKAGDRVLLSFDYCNEQTCHNCSKGMPGYCGKFNEKNIICAPGVYGLEDGSAEVAGHFFGQSSFANKAIAKGTSVLNVSDLVQSEEELKMFGPLGCGFQTGAGSVTELADVKEGDSVVVFGLGGVGMLAVMAAKIRGARTIIAVDRVPSRFETAKQVGATHTVDTSNFTALSTDLSAAIKEILPNGTLHAFDTTGVVDIVQAGVDVLHTGGQLILIGIMSGKTLNLDLQDMLGAGKSIRGCIEGNAKPKDYVPRLIQWYREGKLPIEKLIKFYPVDDFDQALHDMHTGATVKPILVW